MFSGVTDIGMLFVRCGNGGISHSPLETVMAADADVEPEVEARQEPDALDEARAQAELDVRLVLQQAPDGAGETVRRELLEGEMLPYQLDGVAFAVGAGRAILADDMIDTAGTLKAAAQTVLDEGAASVIACAARGLAPTRRNWFTIGVENCPCGCVASTHRIA